MNLKRTLTFLAGVAISCASFAQTLRSGDISMGAGGVGTPDPQVHYNLVGGGPLVPADFANPQTWKMAHVCSDVLWGAKSTSLDPMSQWINPSGQYNNYQTALFAHGFNPGATNLVNISLTFVVDDTLGNFNTGIDGVYVNGTSLGANPLGSHTIWTTVNYTNVAVNANTTNWLYLYNIDVGRVASGIQYTAVVSAVPEPASIIAFACGGAALLRRRLRRSR
ncbi:MAG: hypothetical protein HONBIEJF_02123 [Fimbriimonadaceae bacterium]|nr:hypothetical protein [Fimbriimonadaceae bacterium]